MTEPDPERPHQRRRTRHRRWRIDRRGALLLGGALLVLLVAAGLSLALGGGVGAGSRAAVGATAGASHIAGVAGASGLEAPGSGGPAGAYPAASPGPGGSAGVLTHPVVATRIVIARLGIDLPIVEGDGVDAPLYKVAHYPGTAWPGGGSNIYLYGHARDGMFIALWHAKLGDQVVLDLANGGQRTYVVSKILPDVPWNDMAVLAPTPHEQLTLQTCTSYEQTAPRFVVIAVPQS